MDENFQLPDFINFLDVSEDLESIGAIKNFWSKIDCPRNLQNADKYLTKNTAATFR